MPWNPTPIDSSNYTYPRDLKVTDTPIRRFLVIGSCLVVGLPSIFNEMSPESSGDYVLFNNGSELPDHLPSDPSTYDLQIVQVALRSVIPENAYFGLDYKDVASYQALFEESKDRLDRALAAGMKWNRKLGMTTFVMNFLVPQQNPLGRFMPRYDLRNMVFFVEELNRYLDDAVKKYKGAYILDINNLTNVYGKKFFQDDSLWQINHGAALTDADFQKDSRRLHPPKAISERLGLQTWALIQALWGELNAMYRTLKQADAVKLVVFDLDDTLWRGVLMEENFDQVDSIEGWPLGLAEAITYLRRRGIVLAIASKNDDTKIRERWNEVWFNRLRLEDFASVHINWNPKSLNIAEIIKEVNVLPSSVVFVDDNPVERAAVEAAIPGIRTLGSDLYSIRRTLLWASETQQTVITDESTRRNEMVQAQISRDNARKSMSHEDFLYSLNVDLQFIDVETIEHPRFERAYELLNKTNQFNTTGERWDLEKAANFIESGGSFHCVSVKDKYTDYGLVVVVVLRDQTIEQYAMSCRILGLGVETQAVRYVIHKVKDRGAKEVIGVFRKNEANHLASDLFRSSGFEKTDDGLWVMSLEHALLT